MSKVREYPVFETTFKVAKTAWHGAEPHDGIIPALSNGDIMEILSRINIDIDGDACDYFILMDQEIGLKVLYCGAFDTDPDHYVEYNFFPEAATGSFPEYEHLRFEPIIFSSRDIPELETITWSKMGRNAVA